jgi:tetratricopeptide (TPR) repeat protein
MECNGLNRLRMMTILAFLFYLLMSSGLTFAQTADDYFQQGKTDLGQGSLENAYNNFKSALTLDPNHQGANLFYALTRILMISKSPAFNKLLDKADVSKEGRDIFDWTADFKRDPSGKILLPSDSPTGKELQDFLKNNILPEINGALDNLAKVGSSYNTILKLMTENGSGLVNSPNTFTLPDTKGHWGPNELVGCKLKIGGTEYTITGNNPGNNQNTITVSPNWAILPGTYNYEIYEEIEIDYGDVLISKGSLYLAKGGIILLTSYNLAIDIDKIASLYQAATLNIQTDLINTYKDFLKLLPVQQVSQAKDLFAEAIDDFTSAINFIVAETDDQENDLFKVDPLEKDRFLNLLADLKNALSGTTFVREIGYDVNLTEFFDNPKTLRDFLPTFLGPYFIKKDSFPDPTFGGILPNMTSTELQKNLKEVIRESYPTPNQYTLTVSKSGTGSGTVTSSPAGIDCGSNCTEDVKTDTKITLKAKADTNSTFTGWSGGGCSGTGTCVVVMNADIAVTAAFSAKTPDISVSPSSLDFGSVNVGKKVTKPLKIMNNGTGDLVITLSGLEGTDFSIQGSSSVTIKSKKSYTLKVLCIPTSGGLKTAILKIQSNDPDTPTLEISLTATLPATTPDISVAQTSLDFGSVKVGKKVTKTLKIGNNGTGDLVMTLSGLEETDFSIQGSSSVTIKSKKSYTLKVLFTPKSAGLETATLEITSNDPDTPILDIPLSGIGQ